MFVYPGALDARTMVKYNKGWGKCDFPTKGNAMMKEKTMKWYAVSTMPGKEGQAETALRKRAAEAGLTEKIGECLVPMAEVDTRRTFKDKATGEEKTVKVTQKKKVFGGYMLIEMDMSGDTWHLVKDTPKIFGFVGGNKMPRPVPTRDVLRIKERMEKGTLGQVKVDFDEGDRVRIMEGAFKGFNGDITDVNDEKRRLKVAVPVFGRPTDVEVAYEDVEKIEVV